MPDVLDHANESHCLNNLRNAILRLIPEYEAANMRLARMLRVSKKDPE
jgi:hypothetical protein